MPKPKKHVFICAQNRGPGHPRGSCMQSGCVPVFEEFLFELQKRNLGDRIAVTNTGCLGPCGTGPNVLVYPEGVMYGNVGKGDVTDIFDQHLEGDVPVTRLLVPPEVWG